MTAGPCASRRRHAAGVASAAKGSSSRCRGRHHEGPTHREPPSGPAGRPPHRGACGQDLRPAGRRCVHHTGIRSRVFHANEEVYGMEMQTIGSPGLWAAFAVFVALALLVDFRLMRSGGPHEVSPKEALRWSAAWIALALLFNAALWAWLRTRLPAADADRVALEFLAGYLVEKSLAVDNIFVFLMLFTYFRVPPESQQRVLAWGVMGAFVLLTGAKMLWSAGKEPDLERNPVLRWITSHLPLTRGYHGEALWVGHGKRRCYTPLFVVLVMIGVTDVIFAVDSIPAIFAITTDPFIVLTSNVFAVLGLRALYFLLANMAGRFHLLSVGLALVLVFIGGKILLVDVVKILVFFVGGEAPPALTVQPQKLQGLLGVLTAPMLHGSVEHLAANSLSILLLGTLAGTVFPRATLRALPLLWLGAGLGTWLIGTGGHHPR